MFLNVRPEVSQREANGLQRKSLMLIIIFLEQ